MHRFGALSAGLLSIAALAFSVAPAREARGGDAPPKRTRIDLTCTGEAVPAQVAPGGKGELVLRARLRAHVHVYADDTFSVLPVAHEGVTYGTPVLSPSSAWKDPSAPAEPPIQVWFDTLEVRVPFTLAPGAVLPLHVGANLKWSACDEGNCYPPDKLPAPVLVQITAPASAASPAAAGPGEPVPPSVPPIPPTPADTGLRRRCPPRRAAAGIDRSRRDGGARRPRRRHPDVESKVATLALSVSAKVRILFTPVGGYHLYAPGAHRSHPRGDVDAAHHVTCHPPRRARSASPTVRLSRATDATAASEFHVHWQGCSDFGVCERHEDRRLAVERTGAGWRIVDAPVTPTPTSASPPPPPPPSSAGTGPAAPTPPSTPAGADLGGVPGMAAAPPSSVPTISSVAPTGLLFPVDGERKAQSWIEGKWKDWGLLFLGPIFLVGLLLAFTPCVLPLIPITVSIVGGSQENPVARGRMTVLLSSYVLGLALAFGALGLAASFGGASLSAAFKSPYALWGIAGIFVVLAFGMFGVYEMQPPAALQRLMGGAKGGSVVGSFLFGALSAVIARSTGP
jgi:hypothetical protein